MPETRYTFVRVEADWAMRFSPDGQLYRVDCEVDCGKFLQGVAYLSREPGYTPTLTIPLPIGLYALRAILNEAEDQGLATRLE